MTKAAPPSPQRAGRAVMRGGLLDLRPGLGVELAAVWADDAVARG